MAKRKFRSARGQPRATLSQKTRRRSPETVAKRKSHLLSVNPLAKNASSIAQNCFATQGCAALRILIVFCKSGLRWSAYSHCVLQVRVALVCVFLLCLATQSAYSYCVLQFWVALVCVFLLCFAPQGCAGLRILIVLCKSGLRWSAYSFCVLHFRVALLCVFLLCFASQGCAGLRSLIAFCKSGLRWSAYSYCVLQVRVALVCFKKIK